MRFSRLRWLQSRESEIEHLKLLLIQLLLIQLRRMQFGRKSEKLERQIEQLELRLEDLQQNSPRRALR
jgi:transposase